MRAISKDDFAWFEKGNKPNAIETVYKGYRFRSRLEARWAVFFDYLKIRWEYEPEGYYVGMACEARDEDGNCPDDHPELGAERCTHRRMYLPDFRLPDFKSWVEVKGDVERLDFDLLADAVDWGMGLPDMSWSMSDNRGLLVLGPIPSGTSIWLPLHPILQHHKGGWLGLAQFCPGGFTAWNNGDQHFDSSWGDQTGQEWTKTLVKHFHGDLGNDPKDAFNSYLVSYAYDAARQARFEHGESG